MNKEKMDTKKAAGICLVVFVVVLGWACVMGIASADDGEPLPTPSPIPTQMCEDEVAPFESEYSLDITVINEEGGDQTITIAATYPPYKVVAIYVYNNQFTCDEVVDLLTGLDLANFDTLPERLKIYYSEGGVYLEIYKYLEDEGPILYVWGLNYITGSGGDFSRPNLCCDEKCGGSSDDKCFDERIIVGATKLMKMVQGYGTKPMGYDSINIYSEGGTFVQYGIDERLLLTIDFGDLLSPPTGIFESQVAAVDVVTAFGDYEVWAGGPPSFTKVNIFYGDSLDIQYGTEEEPDQLTVEVAEGAIEDPETLGEVMESFGSHEVFSTPAFKKVYISRGESLDIQYGTDEQPDQLTVEIEEGAIEDPETLGEVMESFGSHEVFSKPGYSQVYISRGESLDIQYGNETEPEQLTVEVAEGAIEDPETLGEVMESFGSHEVFSTPAFSEVYIYRVSDLMVEYRQDGVLVLTLTYTTEAESALGPEKFGITLKVFGSNDLFNLLIENVNNVRFEYDPDTGDVVITSYWDGTTVASESFDPDLLDKEKLTSFVKKSSSKEVYIDIRPCSCQNPLNTKSKGVLPVAVLGTKDFDVRTIDPTTIRLTREGISDGAAAIRWCYGDVSRPNYGDPCDCKGWLCGRDRIKDLLLTFKTQELVEKLKLSEEKGNTVILTLTGNLKAEYGGTKIKGVGCIRVLKKGACHVKNIDMSTGKREAGTRKNVWAIATVKIVDGSGMPVIGALVSGHWSGATSDSDSGLTDANGVVMLNSDSLKNPKSRTIFTFTMDEVAKEGWTYDPSANRETKDSITV